MVYMLQQYATPILTALCVLVALLTTLHIILFKRETRAALGWIGLSWLAPVIGSALYLVLGINRIERRAASLRGDFSGYEAPTNVRPVYADEFDRALGTEGHQMASLARLVDRVVSRPLMPGNTVEPLINGDAAYPAMMEAIDGAETSITMCTYIFDNDDVGIEFAEALGRAVERGVAVRVLVDAAGLRYSFPSVIRELKKRDVPCARFLPSVIPPHLMTANLRNHRKIMVVDGELGFTGGMNIRAGHRLDWETDHPIRDLHFRVTGPVVAHLQEAFVDDWNFSTGEELRGDEFFPDLEPTGDVFARGINDGPDEDLEKLPWTIQGAVDCATDSIRIMTPYFLPEEGLMSALNTAALRGVEVDIILPADNNLPFVAWAAFGQLRPLLERGCRVWLSPEPFDHTKLMVVDEAWTLLGSANIDPRSLRLNFEFNLECYDRDLAETMNDLAVQRREASERLTLEAYDNRPFLAQVRDNLFRLFAPYF